jgi:hypothetical protein
MEKIRIPVSIRIPLNQSEYRVYYDYCLKYYQVHDSVRKQSIHAFLDLYGNGIIPVDNQDIQQARNFLAGKCSELKKEQNAPGRVSDATMLFQLRVCSDISLFVDDLEKMHRLFVKQGIVADYVMILGIFSKIINEDKSSHVLIKYDLKDDVIESLASPLAEIIRQRLGNEPPWSAVLHDLIVIALRFNSQYSEPKFDLDILMLIAPAVVAFFDKDVPSREILAKLPSYFEEHELDEFETFLHQEPGKNTDQDANINWVTIHEPLEVIASAVGFQRNQWSQGMSKISDQSSTAPPSDMLSPYRGHYPVASPHPTFLAPMHGNGFKTLDIVVNPDEIEQAMSPLQENSPSGGASGKSGLMPFIPIIIGVAVILIILSAAIFFSGYLIHPMKNSTNISPTPTIVEPKSSATVPTPTYKSYSSYDIGNHLLDIAYGPDNNVIKKPTTNRLVVSLDGMYNKPDIDLVNTFIGQFNNYSSTIKLSENINFNNPADIALDFQPATNINQINTTVDYKDPQNGTRYFSLTKEIAFVNSDVKVKTYVNSDLRGEERKRWILRAVLYNLGFYGETAKYPDSIFYAGTNNASQLSDIDLKALQLMFGTKITNGMNKDQMRLYIL